MKPLLLATLPLFALDQFTKWLTIRHLPFESNEGLGALPGFEGLPVFPRFFHLVHWGNIGSAFGMFKGEHSNTAFIILSLVVLVGLLIAWARGAFADAWNRWGVALLLAGILGNVTDRLLHGHVVDMLLFYLHIPFANPWPAFNVADACICGAVGLLFIAAWQAEREERRRAAGAPAGQPADGGAPGA